jgi:secretion/DNA translocation related TadE-like protein
MRSRGRGDAGSASLYVLAVVSLICSAGLVTLAAGQALALRHRAGTAADLAALAAADRALEGTDRACAHAAGIAESNGARLAACSVQGDVVDLLVEMRLPAALSGLPPVRARARAGPTG